MLIYHVAIEYRRKCVEFSKHQIKEMLRQICNRNYDLIKSLVGDVIDLITIDNDNGRPRWLTEAFMSYFSWNSRKS